MVSAPRAHCWLALDRYRYIGADNDEKIISLVITVAAKRRNRGIFFFRGALDARHELQRGMQGASNWEEELRFQGFFTWLAAHLKVCHPIHLVPQGRRAFLC